MENFKQNTTTTKKVTLLWAGALAAILVAVISIFGFAHLANAANSSPCFSYEQTDVSSATIQVTGVSSFSAESENESVATVSTADDKVTVTGVDGAVGIANINITYNSTSTYTVAVPVGYTVFSFDEDTLTVMPGNSSNYGVEGIDYTVEDPVEVTPTQEGSNYIYKNTNTAKMNVKLKKKGGTYVFTGSSDNMSITVTSEAKATSTLLMASCHLTSQVTSPITINKDGTVQTVVTALEGHSNSLTDSDFNNADVYGEDGNLENQYYAESACIKGKASANLLLNGTGSLKLTCNSKNAIKMGTSGNLTIENINLDVESVDHGISSDNTMTINSGSVIVNSVYDAIRSNPDEVSTTTAGVIEITGGTFNLVTSSTGDGIQADGTLAITDGSFNIKTYGGSSTATGDDTDSCKGLKSGTTMAITGGDFVLNTADDAIHAESDCTVTGGNFNIATGDDGIHAGDSENFTTAKLTLGSDGSEYPYVNITTCYEGLEGCQIVINSGTYSIIATDDGINAALGGGLESTSCNIIINGGNIYVNVDGDGVDANGSITINGGTCVVFGQTSTNGSNNPYDTETSFIINGGTVFGAGGNNPAANAPSGSSQGSIIYGGSSQGGGGGQPQPGPGPAPHSTLMSTNVSDISANQTIDVKNASSQTAFSVKTPKTVNYVIYSDSNNPSSSWSIQGDSTTPTWTTSELDFPTCVTDGHSYTSEYIIEPTCVGEGTVKKTCSVCGATSYATVDALGHDLDSEGACSRCSYGASDKTSISSATMTIETSSYVYSGSAITPTPTVTLTDGETTTTLTKGTDYTLSYSSNVNVGTATVTATGIGNYSGTKSTTFTITRLGIDYPKADSDLTYTGNEQIGVPFGTGYNITGNQQTFAGKYTAVATPDSNHMWSYDSSTDEYSIDWSIAQAAATVSFGNSTATVLINGTQTVTPTIVTDSTSFDCVSSNTSILTASYDSSTGVVTLTSPSSTTGTATVTLTANEGTNYKEASATLSVTVSQTGTATVPEAKTGLTYTGLKQIGVVASGTGYTLSGNTGTDAGPYTATATISAGYTWTDGTTAPQTISWSIGQATGTVSVGASSAVVPYGTTREIAISAVGDSTDEISAVSSATSVATVSYNSLTSKITVTPVALGTATITVTKDAGTNYTSATDTCTIYVTQGEGSTTISKESMSITTDESATATISVVGDGSTTAVSSDTSIATASLSGSTLTITGVAEGTATITVSTTAGTNYTASSDTLEVTVSDLILPDGTYYFGSSASVRQVIDVSGGSTANGANIQLYSANQTTAQKWTVTNVGNNTVTIKNASSGKALDVAGGTNKAGTNVWQYTYNGSNAQKWVVQENSDGSYTFKSCINNKLVLDLSGGNTGNGTNVQVYTSNSTAAQKFFAYNLSPSITSSGVEIDEGYYAIQSYKNTGYQVDLDAGSSSNGANIHLWSGTVNTNDNQCFKISPTTDGFYTIANCNTGKVLDVAGGCVLPGTNVQQYASNNTNAQKWNAIQIDGEDDVYTFQNVGTGMVLDVSGGSMKNGANIQTYISNGTSAQKWHLAENTYTRGRLDTLASEYADEIDDGTYTVEDVANGTFVLDVSGGSSSNGANVQLYSSNKSNAQKWKVTHDDNGYLTITNVGSGKVLDVAGGTASAGTNVQQYTSNSSWAQKWIAVPLEESSTQYQLISGLSDSLQLGLGSSSVKNGTNVQLVSTSTATRNLFTFENANIATVPTAKTGLTYTGSVQTGVEAGTGYTVTGNTATAVGTYTATATLNSGYIWADKTYDDKTITWSIGQATGSISFDSSSVTVVVSKTKTVTPTITTDGTVTCQSADESIATASYASGTLTLTGVAAGSTTVTLSAPATTNYTAATGTLKVTVSSSEDRTSYIASVASKNAILCSGTTDTYNCISVNKTGDASGEDADFYGTNAAILCKNSGKLTISDAIITTAAQHANAVFSYGGTINISDSTINTTSSNSGGVMVTGGGVLTATDVDATTTGNSSAPIRSDRGGGTLTVNNGTFTSSGTGSPAIYSTATIKAIGAKLISNHSEGVIVEGKNSATLNNCTLTDTNDQLNGQSTTYKNVFLYQSASGDASTGTAEFSATGSTITTNKGDTFYVTNNSAQIDLENNTITNNDSTGYLLRAKADAWGKSGSNGGKVTFNLTNQTVSGNIYIDSISTLAMNMKSASTYTGTINGAKTANTLSLALSSDSKIVLTGNSYVTSFSDADSTLSNIDTTNGHLYYTDGTQIK